MILQDFNEIVLLKSNDGSRVLLSDVATIKDGFIEDQWNTRINGVQGYSLDVFITQNPSITATSAAVEAFVEQRRENFARWRQYEYLAEYE